MQTAVGCSPELHAGGVREAVPTPALNWGGSLATNRPPGGNPGRVRAVTAPPGRGPAAPGPAPFLLQPPGGGPGPRRAPGGRDRSPVLSPWGPVGC